jgi:hypothetical protein
MPKEVEHCVTRVLPRLRSQYPGKKDSELEPMAWGICTKMYKEGKLNEEGECVLSTGEKVW